MRKKIVLIAGVFAVLLVLSIFIGSTTLKNIEANSDNTKDNTGSNTETSLKIGDAAKSSVDKHIIKSIDSEAIKTVATTKKAALNNDLTPRQGQDSNPKVGETQGTIQSEEVEQSSIPVRTIKSIDSEAIKSESSTKKSPLENNSSPGEGQKSNP